MKTLIPLLLLPLALSTTAPHTPEVARISLGNLARFADAIFVGRIEEVIDIPQPDRPVGNDESKPLRYAESIPVARVTVLRPIEGVRPGATICYLAKGAGSDEAPTAAVGETALFFLDSTDWADLTSAGFRTTLLRMQELPDSFELGHEGCGLMPLHSVDALEHVTPPSEVELPPELPTVEGPAAGTRSVRLDLFDEQVRRIVREQRPYARLVHRIPLQPDRGWELEVWGDGVGWLHVDDPRREEDLEIKIGTSKLVTLKRELDALARRDLLPELGQVGLDGPKRSISIVSSDGKRLAIEINTLYPELELTAKERDQAVEVLELWQELRGLFDVRGTIDVRAFDRRCIDEWR